MQLSDLVFLKDGSLSCKDGGCYEKVDDSGNRQIVRLFCKHCVSGLKS